MANPFLTETPMHAPTTVTDNYNTNGWFGGTPYHIAGMLLVALIILTALKVSGFRAMVGIGRS